MPFLSFTRTLIFSFALHLFAGEALMDEFTKLPYLWRHFQEARSAYPGKSFGDYLWQHYADPVHREADPEHRHLPFFSAEITALVALRAEQEIFRIASVSPARSTAVFSRKNLLPTDYRAGILQPPETCI